MSILFLSFLIHNKRLFFSSCCSDSVSLGIQKEENPFPVLFVHPKLAQNFNLSKTSNVNSLVRLWTALKITEKAKNSL